MLESRRILLIAETGTGKTNECKAQAKLLFEYVRLHFFWPSRMWWQQVYVCAFTYLRSQAQIRPDQAPLTRKHVRIPLNQNFVGRAIASVLLD